MVLNCISKVKNLLKIYEHMVLYEQVVAYVPRTQQYRIEMLIW